MTPDEARRSIEAWVREAVIGLGLCPFAAPVVAEGDLGIRVSDVTTAEEALREVLSAASDLLDQHPGLGRTVLVGFTRSLSDFDEYLAVVAAVEGALQEAGAEGLIQVASFHPDYRFEGSETDDLGNWTNRSPLPVVHLLQEVDVGAAVASHPDPEGIPAANIRRLEELGLAGLEAVWCRFQTASEEE
ncbi:MAG: DUF1415 domain-containing protein [Myxococcota bacterium]|nr:DUF1415 domain-containing protein [Myxococcota bacterium]